MLYTENNNNEVQMTKKYYVLTMLIILCFGLISEELTLDQAKKMLIEKNLDYKSSLSNVKSAEEDSKSSFYNFLPKGSLTANHTPEVLDGEESTRYGLTINQPILSNGNIFYSNKIKKESFKISDERNRQKRIELLIGLEQLYYDVLEATQNYQIAERAYNVSIKHNETGVIKLTSGILSKDQFLNLEVDVANKELTLIERENSLAIKRENLKKYLDSEVDYTLADVAFEEVEDIMSQLVAISSDAKTELYNKLCSYSEENNSQLIISDYNNKLAAYNVSMNKMSYLPSLNLSYNVNWAENPITSDMEDQSTISLTASLPIFPLMNTHHNIKSVKYKQKESQYSLMSLQQSTKINIKNSFDSFLLSLKRINLSSTSLELRREIFKQKEAKFYASILSVEDMLDAEMELIQANEQYVSTLYGYLKMEATLRKTIGIEEKKTLDDIIINILAEK